MQNSNIKKQHSSKNKLCYILNNERPSQMLKNQSTYKAPNLIQYGRQITCKNIQDYKFIHNVNKHKISSAGFEEISLFANYIVGVNIAHVSYLREKVSYLPQEIWLLIGSIIGCQFNKSKHTIIENRTNFYIEYNMIKEFPINYNTLNNIYTSYKEDLQILKLKYLIET